jgi:integrase
VPQVKLTEVTLRNLKPPERGQKTYLCDALPGFGCRVSQGGTKTFVLVHGRDRRRVTIGRYPIISLAEARATAKRILAERTLGRHQPRSISWDEALQIFLGEIAERKKPRTVADYTRLLKRHFPFGRRLLTEIRSDDVTRRLDQCSGAPTERRQALTVAKIFFHWAQRPPRRYITQTPCDGLTIPRRPSGKRVLTDKEIATLWNAANGDLPFHQIVRLCLLLGQRRGEIGTIRAEFVDWSERTITWPDTKSNRPHTIPFGLVAEKILRTLPTEGFLFPGRYDKTAYNAWSKDKNELDAQCRSLVEPWTLHDLRRTAATNWARLGTTPHVVERLLNHAVGSLSNQTENAVSPVARVYNRHLYMDEMRDALSKWGDRLTTLCTQTDFERDQNTHSLHEMKSET